MPNMARFNPAVAWNATLAGWFGGVSENAPLNLNVSGTTSFGEDASGHVYIASLAGPVYRLTSR